MNVTFMTNLTASFLRNEMRYGSWWLGTVVRVFYRLLLPPVSEENILGNRGIGIPSSFRGCTHRQEKTSFSRLLLEAMSRPLARTLRGVCGSPVALLLAPATTALEWMRSPSGT